MEIGANVIILAPILAPIAVDILDLYPLHFAIIMLVNLNIGLLTSPLGERLFIVSGITGISLEEVIKAIFPMIVFEMISLLAITFILEILLFSPKLFGY